MQGVGVGVAEAEVEVEARSRAARAARAARRRVRGWRWVGGQDAKSYRGGSASTSTSAKIKSKNTSRNIVTVNSYQASPHIKPLVEVQGKLNPRRIFNGAMPALGQTDAQHLPWGITVAYIDVGFRGHGVVDESGERRFGRVVGDSTEQHTLLDAMMRSSELDRQVLMPLNDIPNAAHFIEAKLKPVDRARVKAMVKAAKDVLEGTYDGRAKLAQQQTLDDALAAMRNLDGEDVRADYKEIEQDDDAGEEQWGSDTGTKRERD